MPFPASLATITVTGSFQTYPSGGAGTGSVTFTNENWLFSSGDDEIIAPFEAVANLDVDGDINIVLPATNDPQWAPQGWSYGVSINVGGNVLTGSLELAHDGPSTVDISDIFNAVDPEAGVFYIPLSQKGVVSGVAALDADGDVIDAEGDKILGGGGGGGDHAASHADGGGDEIAIDASQVTTGTFAIGRIPTGSTGSTVPFGNDARFTDARTPTAHATSHQDGGGDELALDGSQITSGTVGIARIPTGQTGSTVPFGNDARFTDARTPTAHATSHQDGGGDELALDTSQLTSGTLGVARGGTGVATVTANSYLKGNGTSALVPRTYAEVKTDLSLDQVDNVSIIGRFSLITSGEETLSRLQTFSDVDMVLGTVHLAYFTARKTETINNVVTTIPNTAGASNTTSRVGIYSIDGSGNLTLVASTANDTALWTSTGTRTKALQAGWSKVAGTRYAVGMLTIGGTPAQPAGIFTAPSFSGIEPRICGGMTGQSSLPSSIAVGSIVDDYRMYQVLFTP